jgi:hypothetical protein
VFDAVKRCWGYGRFNDDRKIKIIYE